MTSTHDDSTTALAGRPPVVDQATWEAARDELLIREKAHTREGDAIAAARRRLPMVEFDPTVPVVGAGGPVPFLDLFAGREELVVYKHMWHDGAPHQGQCEGCTTTAWHVKDAVYLNARGVSFAVGAARRGRTTPRGGPLGRGPAGTGARTQAAPPTGGRPAGRPRSGAGQARRRRRRSDGTASTTDVFFGC